MLLPLVPSRSRLRLLLLLLLLTVHIQHVLTSLVFAPVKPTIPKQFTVTINYTVEGSEPATGVMLYDFDAKQMLVNVSRCAI